MEEKTTYTTIPAQPGWYISILLEAYDEDPASLQDEPVIAWEIERSEEVDHHGASYVSRDARPLTADFELNGGTISGGVTIGNHWVIKRPDGKYLVPGDCVLDNDAAALAYLVKQVADKRARRAAKKAAQ